MLDIQVRYYTQHVFPYSVLTQLCTALYSFMHLRPTTSNKIKFVRSRDINYTSLLYTNFVQIYNQKITSDTQD